METTAIYATLLYLLAFRLAVIALGALCIYLGYRLFLEGFSGGAGAGEAGEATTLGAKFAGHELTLKNAAPGTFFAAFGAMISISILATSPPEFTVKQSGGDSEGKPREIVTALRGDVPPDKATDLPEGAVEQVWYYYDKALAAADEAVLSEPTNSTYLELQAALAMVEGSAEAGERALAALDRAKRAEPARAAEIERLAVLYRQLLE